ncbi:MAG: hypothetical protein ACP5F2_06880 [Athalassotoga sp.]|uniref:hypothetical protein n=1 Tax=Athalassotoga sp. TaxID=2022597 RepID=UPI003CFF4DC3
MKRYFFILLIFGQMAFALPVSMTISNQEISAGFVATPIEINIGYPQSSISFQKFAGMNIIAAEPLFNPYIDLNIYNYRLLSFFAGTNFEFGTLPQAFKSEKIEEYGRIFLDLSASASLKNLYFLLSYERLVSSVDLNILNNIFFIAPPNPYYPPNVLYLYTSYDFDWFEKENVIFRIFGNVNLNFSDGFIFSTPSIEVGLKILTNTSILN